MADRTLIDLLRLLTQAASAVRTLQEAAARGGLPQQQGRGDAVPVFNDLISGSGLATPLTVTQINVDETVLDDSHGVEVGTIQEATEISGTDAAGNPFALTGFKTATIVVNPP